MERHIFQLAIIPLQAVSSRDEFLFSGKKDDLFMQKACSYGTRPEEKAKSDTAGGKKALLTTLPRDYSLLMAVGKKST
jgi:hypothetical protein